jgi:2-polyprenyl-3-methyl-5-hydroxy-6-metoxy-1,4-benzoquinol methylase
VVAATLEHWPEHSTFLRQSLSERSPALLDRTEQLAGLVERLAGQGLPGLARGYRWMCEMVVEEEFHFRRTGRYRHSRFDEVNAAVYQRSSVMEPYMAGLLLSQVLWTNHVTSFEFYAKDFLGENEAGYRHLEIGPGHGLLLYFAAVDPRCAAVSTWDISPSSAEKTRECLRRLAVDRPVDNQVRDVTAGSIPEAAFDSIAFSEVLEHLEAPAAALANIRRLLTPEGRLFLNVPVNAPAIDHIFLLRSPEEVVEYVTGCGFSVDRLRVSPTSGYTEERARRRKVAMSVALIARRR